MGMFRYTWRSFSLELTLLVLALVWCVPLYFLVVVALKPDREVFTSPLTLPGSINWASFSTAWHGSGGIGLGQALANSIVLVVGTVILLIGFGAICAYTIARRNDRLGNALYLLFVLGIILPYQLAVVPSYVFLRQLGR